MIKDNKEGEVPTKPSPPSEGGKGARGVEVLNLK